MSTSSEQRRRAYEAGFRGDPAPEWAANDQDLLAQYDRGLQDGEDPVAAATSAGSTGARRGGTATKPKPRKTAASTSSKAEERAERQSQRAIEAESAAEVRREGAGSPMPRLSDVPAAHIGGGVTVDDGAGFLLGLFVFALGRAFLVGGAGGARQWLAAKFLNRAGSSSGSAAAGSSGTAPTTPTPPAPWTPTTPTAPSRATTAPIPGNFSTTGGSK